MEKQPLSHQPSRHPASPSFVSSKHNDRDGALWNSGMHSAYMVRNTIIRGDPYTEHDHQYWSLSPPIPSWKLYENPFFTEGHRFPKYIPRYLNSPLHRSANSFTTPDTQHASRGLPPNSHCGLTILAPGLAIKGPIHSDAGPHQPNAVPPPPDLLMSKDKGMPGSLVVSARKLAASFWEQYGVHTLDEAEDQRLSHAQAAQPCPNATSDTLVCPSLPSKLQNPEALENTPANCVTAEASINNMASSPVATLANLLHRMRSVEEYQSQSSAMLSKLTLEMEKVATRVHELEFSHKSALREINNLLQRFGEQMAISRRKEQEKARLAFMRLREEMEEERNSCRVLKIQNKKLTKDLTHANIAAADACEELDRERKARELLEEVCNELAREIGEDKAEVEQLKQEQAESRKRLEEEIKMMRMAAMWRGESVRSKLSEVQQLELDHDKEGMPLHELRSKLEAFLSTIGVTCRGTHDEIEMQAEHAKLLRQALELLELEESRESQSSAKVFSSSARLASAPACANACTIDEKVSTNTEYRGEDHHFNVDADTVNGVGTKFFSKETRKPRKGRRRLRTIAQQRHNLGIRSQYDQNKVNFWEAHCVNSGWSTSDDGQERGPLDTLPNSMQEGYALERGAKDNNLPMHANSLNLEHANMLLAGGHARHTGEKMSPSMFTRSSEHTVKKAPCHPEHSLHNGIAQGSPRRHSSSARFGVEAGRELDCKVEPDMGPTMHYSFSEDDATSYMGSRIERRRKQQSVLHAQSVQLASKPRQEEEESFNFIRNDQYNHDHLNGSKITGRGEVGTENSELDEFFFEPVRGPIFASNGIKLSERANEDEDGTNVARQAERGFSNCGDEACCRIMAKAGQSCKDVKDKVHDSVEGNINFGGKEAMNKMSPWRSASAKPLQCFWPPSPDAFPSFGGVKKRSKAGSSTPPAYIANEQQIHSAGGLRSHSQRDLSPAKEASFQLSASQHQQDVSMKSNSLGAQLIKAREIDCNKPTKPSFRFSPLRRAISHG